MNKGILIREYDDKLTSIILKLFNVEFLKKLEVL